MYNYTKIIYNPHSKVKKDKDNSEKLDIIPLEKKKYNNINLTL